MRKPAKEAAWTGNAASLNRMGVSHWRRAGVLLEQRRLDESRALTDKGRRHAIAAVLGLVRSPPPTRLTSGLVDYYRKLRKLSS